jgi:hypothetical protein
MVDLIRATAMYLCSYCRHFMVLIPLESRGKNLFIHVYKSKWPKISLSRVLTQPVLFPVPKIHEATLKIELEFLTKVGVLKKVNQIKWGAPTFLIPKKDARVQFIFNFHELNKRIK